MRTLDKKLVRDFWQLKAQLTAIGLVIGCGVAMFVLAWSMLSSLKLTQEKYYQQYHFAHVFGHLKRAPLALSSQLTEIPGMLHAQVRQVHDVNLEIPEYPEPATGRMISLADPPDSGLNQVFLRHGRYPSSRASDEVVVSEGFALAHRLQIGHTVTAILNGKRQTLRIVGIGLSPEYVYQIRPGEMIPNQAVFGIFWMAEDPLAAAFDMEGAFNDVTGFLSPGANEQQVLDELDRLLGPYGGLGAYGRDLQTSNQYVTNELRELRNMGFVAPVIFLAVSAFLLNVVLARIVGTQREQIAALKAFGYHRGQIVEHYLLLTVLVVTFGVVAGTIAGAYLGQNMTRMYTNFFRFPVLEFHVPPLIVLAAGGVSFLSALTGVWASVRRAAILPPAVAMQPEAPSPYGPALLERWGLGRLISPTTRMILRHLERKPVATAFAVLGLSMAVGVLVLGNHSSDAIDSLLTYQFFKVQRYDVSVSFIEPTEQSVLHDLRHWPGVTAIEPTLTAVAKLRAGHRWRLQAVLGLSADPQLFQLLDRRGRLQQLTPYGLTLSSKLAELLGVGLGDEVEVQFLERRRSSVRLPVAQLVDDMIGLSAYLPIERLQELMGDGHVITGAMLAVDSASRNQLLAELREKPHVAGASAKLAAVRSFRETLARTVLRMRAINLIFAGIIAFGVVYNTARIIVAERARDLASLRVLGFTRGEISYILLGEISLLTLVAIPLGLVVGYGLVQLTTWGYDTELFRVPVVIYPATYGLASVAILVATAISGLVVRQSLDELDLIAVLKAPE